MNILLSKVHSGSYITGERFPHSDIKIYTGIISLVVLTTLTLSFLLNSHRYEKRHATQYYKFSSPIELKVSPELEQSGKHPLSIS